MIYILIFQINLIILPNNSILLRISKLLHIGSDVNCKEIFIISGFAFDKIITPTNERIISLTYFY